MQLLTGLYRSVFNGTGKCGERDTPAYACVIELPSEGAQTGLDIAKTFAIGQLGEDHREKLIPTGESTHTMLASVMLNHLTELMPRDNLHQLCKDGPTNTHANALRK